MCLTARPRDAWWSRLEYGVHTFCCVLKAGSIGVTLNGPGRNTGKNNNRRIEYKQNPVMVETIARQVLHKSRVRISTSTQDFLRRSLKYT